MSNFLITLGDTRTVKFKLEEQPVGGGAFAPVDLTDALTITLVYRAPNDTTSLSVALAVDGLPGLGIAKRTFVPADFTVTGIHTGQILITRASGQQTYPDGATIPLTVQARL